MYDTITNTDQLVNALALTEQQRATVIDLLDAERANLRLEKERVATLVKEKSALEVEVEDQREISRVHDSTAKEAVQRAARAEEQHRADIALIGEHLLEEAERRDWCSDFDEAVETLNRNLHVELPRRIHDFEVLVEVTVSIPVVVSAHDEEEAAREAESEWRERWDPYNAADRILEGSTGDWDDFDVEEID